MPQRPPPSAGIRVLHFGPTRGPHLRGVQALQQYDPNEHLVALPYGERVRRGGGKGATGVRQRILDPSLRVQAERADIAQQVRMLNPDLVIFHTDYLSRLGVMATYGTRARMVTHRYDSAPIQRGVIRRMAYSRISLWFVSNVRAAAVIEAMGIPRERIRLNRPFRAPKEARSRAASRTALQIPQDRKAFVVHEPDRDGMTILRPLLQAAQSTDLGFSLVLSNPDDDVREELTTLVQAADPNRAQLYRNDPDERLITTVNVPASLAALPGEEFEETVIAAADAILEPSWTDTTEREGALSAMLLAREVVTTDSDNSREAVGNDGVYLDGAHFTQVRNALQAFEASEPKGEALKQRAEMEFSLDNMAGQVEQYRGIAPARAQQRAAAEGAS